MQKENKNWEAVIGLEIHAELKTKSKMFCGCKNDPFHSQANENVCPVCLGMPGTLPVLNKKAIDWTILTGLALNSKVNKFTKWDRKNYFYPDIPKGYQISQYDLPLVYAGYMDINPKSETLNPKQIKNSNNKNVENEILNHQSRLGSQSEAGVKNDKIKRIGITRIHLEEDTGTSKHPEGKSDIDYSLLDYNRAGAPLMELVTEPDIRTAKEAKEFCQNYQRILRTLKVSDANMEKGEMRCEANISVRDLSKSKKLGTKVEVKNLNSFKSVERAIEYEIERQIDVIESGEKIKQQTRGWDEKNGKTYVMREKETSADYRYFPEPDLPPVTISDEDIENLRKKLPELPKDKAERYVKEYKISKSDASIIANDLKKAEYLERITNNSKLKSNNYNSKIKTIVNFMINEISDLKIKSEYLIDLVELIDQEKISQKIAKDILPEVKKGKSPENIIKEKGLEQVSDSGEIESIVEKVMKENQDAVDKIKSGQMGVIGFLVGQVMKESKGKANPKMVNEIIRTKLK